MAKFIRNFRFTFQEKKEDPIIIPSPFTIEFDVTKKNLASGNTAHIKIYNLSENNRNRMRKDQNDFGNIYKRVALQAGYGDSSLATIFSGTVRYAFSVRRGTDYITELQADDGGESYVKGVVHDQFPRNTPIQAMLDKMITEKLPGVSPGAIGSYPGNLSRGTTLVGNTVELLSNLTGGGFFISDGKAYCLGDDEVIQGDVNIINTDSGLLGTPTINQGLITLDMLFEPRIMICQAVELRSTTNKKINGLFRVIGIHHQGIISDSVCGSATTTLTLSNSIADFKVVPYAK